MDIEPREVQIFLEKTVKEAYAKIQNVTKEVSVKGHRDYVTNCDLLVEKYVLDKMQFAYPDIRVLSEEYNSTLEKKEAYFVIDPIDGTINFASGLDIWGIQAAYTFHDEVRTSCLYFPRLDKLFTALKGAGSFVNGSRISVKPYQDIANSLVGFDFSKANEINYDLYRNVSAKVMRVREFGAGSFGFSMVAMGGLDAYCILQNTPWDIEPGWLLCLEAGAKSYRDDRCAIVANNDELLHFVLNEVKKVFKD